MCSPRIERPCPAAIACESFAYSSSSLNTVAVAWPRDWRTWYAVAAAKTSGSAMRPARVRATVRGSAAFRAAVVGTALMPVISALAPPPVNRRDCPWDVAFPAQSGARHVTGPSRPGPRDCPWGVAFRAQSGARHVTRPFRGGRRYSGRTNRPAAAFSPIARSRPFSFTVTCPAAGWASRTSISLPGTRPFVVEPVQELAVVLGQPDDRRPRSRCEIRERREVSVLGLLDVRDPPASRAGSGRDCRAAPRSARPSRR